MKVRNKMKNYVKPNTVFVALNVERLMVDFDPDIPLSGDPLANQSEWDDIEEPTEDNDNKFNLWTE